MADETRQQKRIKRRKESQNFSINSKIEDQYYRSLKKITDNIKAQIKSYATSNTRHDFKSLADTLIAYSEIITPWAERIARHMLDNAQVKNKQAWKSLANEQGILLKAEINNTPQGQFFKSYLLEQVDLIKSLPRESGLNVQKLVQENLVSGERFETLVSKVMELGAKSENRARLIARTETSKAASSLVIARSKEVGVTNYIWRTSRDADVRESHKAMEGKVIDIDVPPEVEPGKFYHAGMFPNCRCYPEPILNEDN